MFNIILVEDDKSLNRSLVEYLKIKGYEVKGFLSAADALSAMAGRNVDLVISDIMMPGMDGFEFAGAVRSVNENLPILFLTARDDFEAKQLGYMAGIDDYMTKPVNFEELNLHIGALLRRVKAAESKKLQIGSLTMDMEEHVAIVENEEIPLTPREFNILFKLLSYPKKTFTRGQLMDEFWDLDSETTLRAVDVYMTKLRDKFSSCDDFKIVTVRGLGYKAVPKGE